MHKNALEKFRYNKREERAFVTPQVTGRSLIFDVFVIPYDADDSWIEPKLLEIKHAMDADTIPDSTPGCKFCHYTQGGSRFIR